MSRWTASGAPRRGIRAIASGFAIAALLWACGGGTNVATVGTGGTGSFTVGAVTGFGSVIVNGRRFDDSGATVTEGGEARSRDDLQLGMVVKVQGSVDSNGNGTATSVDFDSELLGSVSALSSNGFTILGQKVIASTATVYAPSLPNGLGSVQLGQVLEVHGFLLPKRNELQATFVTLKSSPSFFKISGHVSDLTGSSSFSIGTLNISFAGLTGSNAPGPLKNGDPVKVRLNPIPPTAGQPWTATRVRINKDALADVDEAEVEGVVTTLTSTASFFIGNVQVNAANASFRDGSAGVSVGARVEVEGRLVGGVLVAREVKLEDDDNNIELKGRISGLNLAAKTFTVRGQSVSYAGSVMYENGGEANLADGRSVEVKAQVVVGSSLLQATKIEFE